MPGADSCGRNRLQRRLKVICGLVFLLQFCSIGFEKRWGVMNIGDYLNPLQLKDLR